MSVTFVDVLLVLVVLFGVWQGWHRGLLFGLLDLARWVGGLLFAVRFYQPVARWLGPRVEWDQAWDEPAAFLLTALAAGLVIQLVGEALLRGVSEETHRGTVNRTLGMIPGAAGGLISAAILASLLMAAPLPEAARESARQSAFADRLTSYTERLEDQLAPVFDEAIQRTLNRLTIKPESNERVDLGFKVESVRPRPDLEAQMLELVNREREAAGLKPLAPDPELTEVARAHSADMFARGYFAHVSPDGLDPFDRMQRAGVVFRTAGENLALAPTVRVAHTGLMNSPGHRANILRPAFGRLGVGIVDGGYRGIMVSQEFRN
ncbi:MAG TPA: CvpA family protein [Pyrinomonadaceae bacterium]|nr:CvpA family protein [Pyrinomonadaceae bacterium]